MKNTTNNNGLKQDCLAAIRDKITIDMVTVAYAKRLDRWSVLSRRAFEWFLNHDDMDDQILDSINRIKGDKDIRGAVNAAAIRLKVRNDFVNLMLECYPAIYSVEIGKLSILAPIIDALGMLGYLVVEKVEHEYANPTTGVVGKTESNWYTFMEKDQNIFDPDTGLCKGLVLTPGELGGNKLPLNPWETDVRHCSLKKEVLRNEASHGWQLIPHDESWWSAYYRSTEWYKRALKDKIEPEVNLEDRVDQLVAGIIRLSDHDRLYHTYNYTLSGRLNAMNTVEGIAQHGSGKLAWQYADEYTISDKTVAVAEIDGTKLWVKANRNILKELKLPKLPNKVRARSLWDKHSDLILEWLLSEHKDLMKGNYFHGLGEVITKGAGGMTKRLVGQDLSTNGMAVFASNFADETMARMTNISHYKTIEDPHQVTADMLGFSSREAIKDSGVSAGLFHGQGLKNIAKNASLSVPELASGLRASFGPRYTYFNRIAKYVSKMINNMNTSTKMISPDGMKWVNQAYAEKSVVKITYFSLETTSGLRTIEIIRDMPLLFNPGKTQPANILYKDPKSKANDGKLKISGGYANGIHMLDAWMLRQILRVSRYAILTVHDNFYTRGDNLEYVANSIRSSHVKMFKHNYIMRNLEYMAKHSPVEVGMLALPTGDLKKNSILKASEFLQP